MVSNNYHSPSLSFSAPERSGKRERNEQLSIANKSIKVEQEALILKLPTDTLNQIMRFTDWLTDTRSIALSCRRFRTIVDRRSQVVLAKAFFFLRHHPFSHLNEFNVTYHFVDGHYIPLQRPGSPYMRTLLLKSLRPMLSRAHITASEQCSVVDAERLRDRLGNKLKESGWYFDALFHYLLDSDPSDLLISSFLVPLMSYKVDWPSRLTVKLNKTGRYPKIQERATSLSNHEQTFFSLLEDSDWTEEKIKTVDWSLLYLRREHLRERISQTTFPNFLWSRHWLMTLSNIKLPRRCLLMLLICMTHTRLQPDTVGQSLKMFSQACDDLGFIKCALEVVDISYRAVIYSCCLEQLKSNRDLALYAIQLGVAWRQLHPTFLEDREIFLAATVKYSAFLCPEPADPFHIMKALGNLKKDLGKDKEFLMEFLKNRLKRAEFFGRVDRGMVDGRRDTLFIGFHDLSPDLVNDQQFMQEAAQYHPEIFKHVTQNFDNAQDVIALIQQVSPKLLVYYELPEKWRTNEEVLNTVIEKTGVLNLIPEQFRSNRKMALKAIAKNASSLEQTPLSQEKEFVLEAFEMNPRILELIYSTSHKLPLKKWLAQARSRVLKAVQTDGLLLFWAPPRFRKDPEIALAAVFQNARVIEHIDNELLRKEEFLLALHQQAMQRLQPLVEIEMSKATIELSDPKLAR
jgi:hypothetical protein